METSVSYIPIPPEMGRPLKFTPSALWKKFLEFVEWCRAHPESSGEAVKPRLLSISNFLIYIGGTYRWWGELDGSKRDFSEVKTRIREICESHQFDMACYGFYKENIISRALGLAEKSENKHEVSASEDTVRKVEAALLKLSDKEFDSVLSIVNKEDK